jgi:cellulose synthase/poly-beta-1,6-N-acetylglucosamine synthase-like glycosyltransferase
MNFGLEIYFTIIISIFWILIIQWFFRKKNIAHPIDYTNTKVSILVAVRNEEASIKRCLIALNALNFPKDKLEIIIGNDNSNDQSESIISQYIADKPHFKLITIKETLGLAKGKANVLAHLAKIAQGDYLFITDADIAVQANWLHALLAHTDEESGIVTGYTHITGTGLLAQLQSLDWTFAQALMKIFFDTDKPLSAMGNNMMVTKEAYLKTGGYENIPFSVTEDFALFEKVLQLQYTCVQVVTNDVKAYSLPMTTFSALITQRKRWTLGVIKHIPWYLSLLFIIQFLFFPVAIYLSFVSIPFTIVAVLIKWSMQSIFLGMVMHTVKEKTSILALLLFDFYSFYVSIATLYSMVKSRKVVWKGRTFLA